MSAFADEPDKIKFVYWDNLTYPGGFAPDEWDTDKAVRLYETYLDHAVEAERLGYAGISMPEHYTPTSPVPHPNILMAALTQRTSKAQIISGVNVPLHHNPIELAAEFAMIDVLSNGRLEVGLGRHGGLPEHEHSIDIIAGLLHGYDHPIVKADLSANISKSPIYSSLFSDVEMTKISLAPRPVQARVPIWLAATNEDSIAAAARRGMGILTGVDPRGVAAANTAEALVAPMLRYIEIGTAAGHDLSFANVAITCHTLIADSDTEAFNLLRAGMKRHITGTVEMLGRFGGGFKEGQNPLDNPMMKARLDTTDDEYRANPFMFVGTVETVREKLQTLLDAGFTRFILPSGGIGPAQEVGWATARAFAEEVAPDLFASDAPLTVNA